MFIFAAFTPVWNSNEGNAPEEPIN